MKRRNFIKKSSFALGAGIGLANLISSNGFTAERSDDVNNCLISRTRTWSHVVLGHASQPAAAAAGAAFLQGVSSPNDVNSTDSENWGPSEDCAKLDEPYWVPNENPNLQVNTWFGEITQTWAYEIKGSVTRVFCDSIA